MDGAGRKQENINRRRRDEKGVGEGYEGNVNDRVPVQESDVAGLSDAFASRACL